MEPSRTHPFRRDERPGLDVIQTDSGQPVDQLDLEFGRERRLFVLQAVARADFDNLDGSCVGRPRPRCGLAQRASERAERPQTRSTARTRSLDGSLQHPRGSACVCSAQKDVEKAKVGESAERAEVGETRRRKAALRREFLSSHMRRHATSGTRQNCRPACALPVATIC